LSERLARSPTASAAYCDGHRRRRIDPPHAQDGKIGVGIAANKIAEERISARQHDIGGPERNHWQ
jgi:hypothetical protein